MRSRACVRHGRTQPTRSMGGTRAGERHDDGVPLSRAHARGTGTTSEGRQTACGRSRRHTGGIRAYPRRMPNSNEFTSRVLRWLTPSCERYMYACSSPTHSMNRCTSHVRHAARIEVDPLVEGRGAVEHPCVRGCDRVRVSCTAAQPTRSMGGAEGRGTTTGCLSLSGSGAWQAHHRRRAADVVWTEQAA